ncbi:MAG TPA: 3-phosphoshikimate 1-carboxyvinyltransferase [bacterium]|nr:3-phosphoshikimate 1-carboxyvinyltransferase [bacterium]
MKKIKFTFFDKEKYKKKNGLKFAAPGSKSSTNRRLLILGLSENNPVLENILISEDTLIMINALYDLGVSFKYSADNNQLMKTGNAPPRSREIYLGYAGTAYRFLPPYLLGIKGDFRLFGEPELHKRPISELLDCLNKLITGKISEDKERGITAHIEKINDLNETFIDAERSSQFLTAVLLTFPVLYDNFTINCLKNPASSYIDLTLSMMEKSGVKIEYDNRCKFKINRRQKYNFSKLNIEGDYSAASYFFGLSAISGMPVEISNLDYDSKQGDKKFLEFLEKTGCKIRHNSGQNVILITPPEILKCAGEIDMSKMQDAVPTAAVTAAFANGETKIVNIGNLKYKECDRFNAIICELKKIGAAVEYGTDWISVTGNSEGKDYIPAEIDTYKDHRMAMAFSLAALKIPGLTVKSPECVCKTFPEFFDSFLPLFENVNLESQNFFSDIFKNQHLKFKANIIKDYN